MLSLFQWVLRKKSIAGITLAELLVAIAVTALLMPLVLYIYINFFKGFKHQSDTAFSAQALMVTRIKIAAEFDRMNVIRSVGANSIEYLNSSDTLRHTLHYSKHVLKNDSNEIIRGLDTCIFAGSVRPDSSACYVSWEARAGEKGWVGGAVVAAWRQRQLKSGI
jgi:hypothetical protein